MAAGTQRVECKPVTVNDLSQEYLFHRRKINFGVGEIKIEHPNAKAVECWKLKNVLQATGQTGLPIPVKQYKRPTVVDTEKEFRNMMTSLHSVNEVTIHVKCTQKLSYFDEMVWLQIGTLHKDFLVDFFTLSGDHKTQLRTYFSSDNVIVVMFAGSDDIISLRRSCDIFLTGVVDLQLYWMTTNQLKHRPGYRQVMEQILKRTIKWNGEEKAMERSDFLLRQPTIAQMKYMQESVHYLLQAWFVIKVEVSLKDLQQHGVNPIKARIAATDYIADRNVTFDKDLKQYLENHACKPLSADVQERAQLMWEYRKYLAMVYNRVPQDVCPMAQIVWMAVAMPGYQELLEEGLRDKVKADSPLWKRTRICVELLKKGMQKWEELSAIECFVCGNSGHMFQQCYRKKKAGDNSRYLSKHPKALARKQEKSNEQWMRRVEKKRLPPDTKPPRYTRIENRVRTSSTKQDGSEWFEGDKPFLLPPRHLTLAPGEKLQNRLLTTHSSPSYSGKLSLTVSWGGFDYNVPETINKVGDNDEKIREDGEWE